ncbi:hypothetical protein Anas_00561 [Armadillidium nasatum]|uniref:Uncharacterized protein n=1 Tax=Armadillidium nasatum TaxID=96803 RepID=A0A5N5TM49_9CRUS|nr:hypothetical protein Anas_00561 [Armadillidium nasatum]
MLWTKQWSLKNDDPKALIPDLTGSVPSGTSSPYSSVQTFVDHSTAFPSSVAVSSTGTDGLFESMAMSQATSNHVYSTPLATTLGNNGVAMADYTYSSPYTQYTASYPAYGYGTGSLLSK